MRANGCSFAADQRVSTVLYDKQLIRGIIVNGVGLAAKLLHPLFVITVAWLFGTDIAGLYFLAFFLGEFAASAVTAGYNDATTIFASPLVEEPERRAELYQIFANAMAMTLVLSGLTIAIVYLGVEWFVETLYPTRPQLVEALKILSWSLPLAAVVQVFIAATKALMKMEYHVAVNFFARPLVLLLFTIGAWYLDAGFNSLMWAQVASYGVAAAMSVWAFARHFSLVDTFRAMTRLRFNWEMLHFALPQNLNITINQYLTRIDVIMLGAFGLSNHNIAFYSTAALITSNLREVRLVFSAAIGPVLARHHARDERQAFEDLLSKVARWTTALVIPLILLLIVMRADVLLIFHESFVGNTWFMVALLLAPYANCAFGLAANAIVYTKHSVWNLFNTCIVAGLNTGFNLLFIPEYGMLGAAIGTSLAAVIVVLLQLIELRFLERVKIRLSVVYRTHIGFFAMLAIVALLWDPAEIGGLGARFAVAGGLLFGYGAVLAAIGQVDVKGALARLARRSEH